MHSVDKEFKFPKSECRGLVRTKATLIRGVYGAMTWFLGPWFSLIDARHLMRSDT